METIRNNFHGKVIDARNDVNGSKGVNGHADVNGIENVNGVDDVNGIKAVNGVSRINETKVDKDAGGTKVVNGVNGVKAVNGVDLDGLSSNTDTNSAKDRDMSSDPPPCPPPIAIIGMGLRLPGGADSSDSFWDLLVNKKSGRCEVPIDRYNVDAFYSPTPKAGTVITRHGHFLKDRDLQHLDTSFFSMNKTEVQNLDPQQKILLEVVRECLENAGETAWRGKKIGCYVGVFGEDWLDMGAKDTQNLGLYRVTATGDFALGNRVSYEYDFRGPSLTVKAGCSSAMIGLHMACQALHMGDCSSAVVCGTNLIITPTMTIAMTEQGVLSPTGSCKTFDAGADGYARGEAINGIYIKMLSDAIRDGNPIRAIIRSTSTNSDGKTQGITCPSVQSHESMIRQAYKVARIDDFSETAFVECHGTGTPVGDPLEAQAVANVFGDHGVFIGSVKPNVGHSEGASGITSVIKTVLALERRIIPPNINFSKPNPKIPFATRKLQVPVDAIPWPKHRERASVNSFGVGGSNAHVILDSAASFGIDTASSVKPPCPQLLVFSANHPNSLNRVIDNYREYIPKNPTTLADLAYTLGARREHLPYRAYCVLQPGAKLEVTSVSKSSAIPQCVFVFTGQGAQWVGMGKALIEEYSSFLEDIRAMDKVLAELPHPPPWTMEDKLLNFQKPNVFSEAEFAQPLCVAIQVAIVNLLQIWGVSPAAVVGHSSGEIAAAYASQAITAAEAITIAFYRGKVTDYQTQSGGMAAVGLGRADILPHLRKGVDIACENSPNSTTLSGDKEQLDNIVQSLKTNFPDIFVRLLKVNVAYHSIQMQEFGDVYQSLIKSRIHSQQPAIPFYSSVSGKMLANSERLDSSYWRRNLTSPVLFRTAVEAVLDEHPQDKIFLEIGPHSALRAPLRQIFKLARAQSSYIPTLVRDQNCTERLLTTIGELYLHTVPTNFSAMHPGGTVLTDLPIYPWNHETKYWNESRLARNWRLRKHPTHEILGSCVAESNAFEPSWRNVLRLNDVPWLRDHRIHENIVFPIAGYVVMIGEAIRQITDGDDYSLRHVVVSAAMIVQEVESTELMTSLRPVRLTSTLDSAWYDFSISSFNGSAWIKHCVGQARAGSNHAVSARNIERLPRNVSSPRWYQTMKKVGLNYGPVFHGLENISASPNDRIAVANIIDHLETNELQYQLHPTVIDLCLQLFSVAMAKGRPHLSSQLFVPTSIAELYIHGASSAIQAEAVISSVSRDGVNGDAIALANGKVVVSLKGLVLSLLEDNEATKDLDPHDAACLVWKPDIEFFDSKRLILPLSWKREPFRLLERLALLCILESCHRSVSSDRSLSHMRKHRSWLSWQKYRAERGEYDLVEDAKELASLDSSSRLARIETTAKKVQLTDYAAVADNVLRVFEHTQGIYEGKTGPLEVLLEDGALQSLYDCSPMDHSNLIGLLTHSKPNLKILEIGAGTGATTAAVLNHLTSSFGERMYSQYYYTDISAGFFVSAMDRFRHASNIVYTVLDISKDPMEQGFEEGFFDLILASNVLHATPKIDSTLRNVRKLLHPEGRLLLQELCPTARAINYIMGVFPGWWLGEGDNRYYEPYISTERWEQELLNSGFGEIDAVIYDDTPPYQLNASIIASPSKTASSAKRVTFLYGSELNPLIHQAQACFVSAGFTVDLCSLTSTLPANQDIISLLDLEGPFFDQVDSAKFDLLKNIIFHLKAAGMLWVTKSAQIECQDPRYAQVLGFARVVRNELSVDLATLELDYINDDAWGALLNVFSKFQRRSKDSDFGPDYEYAVSKNEIHISRFHWYPLTQHLLETPEENSAKTLQIGTLGLLQTLKWEQAKSDSLLINDQVEIKTYAVGMNFKDVVISMGVVGSNPRKDGESAILGCEASGVVRRIGPNVKNVKVGDRVVVLGTGTFTTHLTTSANLCAKIPDDLGFEDAATMPCTYGTVIHSLIELGRLQKYQSVLIHSACGGVGIAAIHICRMMGATIFATVGNEEKAQHLMNTFKIPRHRVFNSRNTSFLSDLMRQTGGRGVDVVLNSLSGELLHASWQCVAEFGTMVEIGKRDLRGRAQLSMDLFEANRAFFGVDLAQIARRKPEVCRRLLEKCMEYCRQGSIWPIKPVKLFEASHVEDAFRYMQKGQHIGKIVVKMPEDPAELPAVLAKETIVLRSDVSYLLVGGLGGLGKPISTWMVERGARNLIYLSRSAEDSTHEAFLSELRAQGCFLQLFAGSVSSLPDVKKAVQNASRPIAGVIQMSMMLRDQLLEQTTAEDLKTVLSPKVTGTWNLHEALETEALDFFVLFSSLSGIIGQWGQAGYAAANTFLDAFVQYRHLRNLPASVLNLGIVEDVGYVSQNQAILNQGNWSSYKKINESGLLDALQLAITRSAPPPPFGTGFTNPNQIVTGLGTRGSVTDPTSRCIWKRDARTKLYRNLDAMATSNSPTGRDNNLRNLLSDVAADPSLLNADSTTDFLTHEISLCIANFMLVSVDDLNVTRTLAEVGVDSLLSIEIRNWWRQSLGIDITVLEIMESATIEHLGKLAADKLRVKYNPQAEVGDYLATKAP